MRVHQYEDHDIESNCSYICVLRLTNVESTYISDVHGRGNLEDKVEEEYNKPNRAIFEITSKHKEYNDSGQLLRSSFNVRFTYKDDRSGAGLWNVIAITDSEYNVYSMAYEVDLIDTKYVELISFTYIITYNLTGKIDHIDIMSYFDDHNETYNLNSHNLPQYLGKYEPESTTVSNRPNPRDLDQIEYTYKYKLNDKLNLRDGTRYFISMSNVGPMVIHLGSTNYVTSLSSTRYEPVTFEMPDVSDIKSFNIMENGKGLVMDTGTEIYVWIRSNEVKDGTEITKYSDPIKVYKSEDYDILIPTFMDLCQCYIRIPNLDKHAPLSYEIRYWTELLNEGEGYFTESNSIVIPRQLGDFKSTYYVERLSRLDDSELSNYSSYYGTDMNNRVVPLVLLNTLISDVSYKSKDDLINSMYEYMRMLYFNLRMIALTYIDVFNNNKYEFVTVTPCDCGLDVVLTDSRYFITYEGDTYILPEGSVVSSGMSYYVNNELDNTHTLTTLNGFNSSSKTYRGKLLHLKYGIPLVN